MLLTVLFKTPSSFRPPWFPPWHRASFAALALSRSFLYRSRDLSSLHEGHMDSCVRFDSLLAASDNVFAPTGCPR